MDVNDLILISVDDHLVEPPDMFTGRLPARFQDQAPRVVGNANGRYNWAFGGSSSASLTTAATVGRPLRERDAEPGSFDEVRPGTYNVHERVKDMNVAGVLASLNFPSFPRFCGQLFSDVAKTEPDLALAVLRAYNDWHIGEWAAAYPDRFIPCAIGPLWDAELMAAELRRVSALGVHAMSFSMNPYQLGLPSLHDPSWDPMWAACDELDIVVCLHIGSNSMMVQTSPDAPAIVRATCSAINIYPTAADLVWSRVLKEFPNITFALSEGGIGWIPYFLERVDFEYEHQIAWHDEHPFLGELPSTRFKERIVTCFVEDVVGVENLHHLNLDNVTWECDYPHPDSSWPLAAESAAKSLASIQDRSIIDKLTHRNAMRIFNFAPFTHRTPQDSTVGALRATADPVDLELIPGRQATLATLTIEQLIERTNATHQPH
jgi:hypothetical protein